MKFSDDGTHLVDQIKVSDENVFTWATKPMASEYIGRAWFSDVGAMGYSDGTNWMLHKSLRSTPVRVATFGSSLALAGPWTSPSNMNTEVFDSAFPGSGNTFAYSYIDRFYVKHIYPQAFLVLDGGVGGETSTQMLARDAAVAGITRKAILDIMDASVDVVILRGISVNAIHALTAAQITTAAKDTEYNNHVAIITRLLNIGVAIIDEGDIGYYSNPPADANVAARQSALMEINARVKAYIAGLQNPKVIFIDPINLTCDETGAFLSNYSYDNFHQSYNASRAQGQMEAIALTQFFGASSDIRYPGANLCSNPLLLTQTTPAYGTLATGYILTSNTNATHQNAKVEVIDGKTYQTCEYVPTEAGAFTANMYAPISLAVLNITSGDTFGIEFDYFAEMLSGMNFPETKSMQIKVTFPKTAAGSLVAYAAYNVVHDKATDKYKGHAIFNPIKINENAAALGSPLMQLIIAFDAADSIAANAIKLGVGAVRIVKL